MSLNYSLQIVSRYSTVILCCIKESVENTCLLKEGGIVRKADTESIWSEMKEFVCKVCFMLEGGCRTNFHQLTLDCRFKCVVFLFEKSCLK